MAKPQAAPHPESALFAAQTTRAASRFAALPPEARKVLRLCDGTRTLAAICQRSTLPTDATQRIVERLVHLGLVAAVAPAKRRSRSVPRKAMPSQLSHWMVPRPSETTTPAVAEIPPAFSSDEEAFFAEPVPEEPIWDGELS